MFTWLTIDSILRLTSKKMAMGHNSVLLLAYNDQKNLFLIIKPLINNKKMRSSLFEHYNYKKLQFATKNEYLVLRHYIFWSSLTRLNVLCLNVFI